MYLGGSPGYTHIYPTREPASGCLPCRRARMATLGTGAPAASGTRPQQRLDGRATDPCVLLVPVLTPGRAELRGGGCAHRLLCPADLQRREGK